jgi:20S proteasome alpha/beta subunit
LGLEETTKLVVKCLAKALEARQLPMRMKIAVVSSETKRLEMLTDEKIEGILKEIGTGK